MHGEEQACEHGGAQPEPEELAAHDDHDRGEGAQRERGHVIDERSPAEPSVERKGERHERTIEARAGEAASEDRPEIALGSEREPPLQVGVVEPNEATAEGLRMRHERGDSHRPERGAPAEPPRDRHVKS